MLPLLLRKRLPIPAFLLVLCGLSLNLWGESQKTPEPGEMAPALVLLDPEGNEVDLKKLHQEGPVVVLFLRGFPGYQCPLCNRQVADFSNLAGDFSKAKCTILLVYPGAAQDLKKHGADFLASRELPPNVRFVTDPDFRITEFWNLRWKAPQETAYPSTFVIAPSGKVVFSKVSRTHGGRTNGGDVLQIVQELAVPKSGD